MNRLLLVSMMAMTVVASGCNEKEAVFQPAVAKLTQSADALDKAGQLDAAVCRLEAASELVPENALVHYNTGILLIKGRRWQVATQHFEKAVSLDPNQANALYSLGVAYASWADEMHMQLMGNNEEEEGKSPAKPPEGASIQVLEQLRLKAAQAFEQFLKVAPSGDPGRAQAEGEIKRLRQPVTS